MARSRKAKGKPAAGKRRIEQYDHKGKKRTNNPPVGLVTRGHRPGRRQEALRLRPAPRPAAGLGRQGRAHLASRCRPSRSTSTSGSTPRPSSRPCAAATATPAPVQVSLFESAEENPPLREAIDFYQHAHGWSQPPDRRRLAAGHELAAREGGHGRQGADGLHRPALRHPLRLELPALRQQARRQGRQRRGPDRRSPR